MKVVTWNVNGIRAAAPKGLFQFLENQKPDFLCIQETKAHPDQVPADYVNPPGYKSLWSPCLRKGYSGTAIYYKSEIEKLEPGIGIRAFDDEGRITRLHTGEFELINIYFPNGGSGDERHQFKQKFLKELLQFLKPKIKRGENIMVVGDYNVAYLNHDVYDPVKLSTESGFLPEEREWMSNFLGAGFKDTFRELHPSTKDRYTWWSYREGARGLNRGWRIDHICVTGKLMSRVKSAEILDGTHGSDHCPVMVELT